MLLAKMVPTPQKVIFGNETFAVPSRVKLAMTDRGNDRRLSLIQDRFVADLKAICRVEVTDSALFTITMSIGKAVGRKEGYRLTLNRDAAILEGDDASGLQYACETLLQAFSLDNDRTEEMAIEDWPFYRTRSVMLDLGRTIFSYALLQRMIRILARLKMNALHLHLYDDQINSVRFERLPLGHENPHALSIRQYGELIRYAKDYGISVVPEFESWGHAGSIVYHFPELQGVGGMYKVGSSFPIGETTFDLLEKMYEEFVPVLDDDCQFHVGLDEAAWSLDSRAVREGHKHTPASMTQRIHDTLMQLGAKYGKRITMRMWMDDKDFILPEGLRDRIIVEPWNYWEADEERTDKLLNVCSGYRRVILGAGISGASPQGAYGATRMWCQKAMNLTNVEGINVTVWGTNDIANLMLGLYAGADYAWTPMTPGNKEKDSLNELQRGFLYLAMREWQGRFADADPDEIAKDRGPIVHLGRYIYGQKHGEPAVATAKLNMEMDAAKGQVHALGWIEEELGKMRQPNAIYTV